MSSSRDSNKKGRAPPSLPSLAHASVLEDRQPNISDLQLRTAAPLLQLSRAPDPHGSYYTYVLRTQVPIQVSSYPNDSSTRTLSVRISAYFHENGPDPPRSCHSGHVTGLKSVVDGVSV